jgi:hypothetical protein
MQLDSYQWVSVAKSFFPVVVEEGIGVADSGDHSTPKQGQLYCGNLQRKGDAEEL